MIPKNPDTAELPKYNKKYDTPAINPETMLVFRSLHKIPRISADNTISARCENLLVKMLGKVVADRTLRANKIRTMIKPIKIALRYPYKVT